MNSPTPHLRTVTSDAKRGEDRVFAGFTLVELLVVITVFAVFAALLLPALASTRLNSQAIQCMDNHKRLAAGWLQFPSDRNDYLPPNGSRTAPDLNLNYWCAGIMDWSASADNTNAFKMVDPTQSAMAGYIESPRLLKCPSDSYKSLANPGPRVRSISMNAALGGSPDLSQQQDSSRRYVKLTKLAHLIKPGPARTLLIMDEHPDSINDCVFQVIPGMLPPGAQFRDLPASHHKKGCGLSFADGHAEIHRWVDSRTSLEVRFIFRWFTPSGNYLVPGSEDYQWLTDRMPYESTQYAE